MGYQYNPFTGDFDKVGSDVPATFANQFDTDSGSAIPAANILNLNGDSAQGLSTSGAGNTVTFTNANASTSQKGVIELATDAETIAGTDSTRGVTAVSLKAKLGSQTLNGISYGGGNSNAINWTSAGANGQLLIGSTGAAPAFANITTAGEDIAITNGANSIDIDFTSNTHTTAIHGWNGAIIETASVSASSDGATITFSVEQSGGGNLTVIFSSGYYDWDTTPAATVSLTAGTDTVPTLNYVYLLESTKALTASTAGWPSEEHAPLATVICETAATFQTKGPYKLHAWTDHVVNNSDDMGHIEHLNYWIRQQHATWQSGVLQTFTITPNGGAADNVIITTASGSVLQLHPHTFPAFSGTPDYYVINDSVTPYTIVTDLNALLTDSNGVSMSGKFFSLVLWGVVSEATGDCKLFINLPSGSYTTQTDVEEDAMKYADYSIPANYKGTGFLIAEWKLRHQVAAGGTWTSIDEIDLRGLEPSIVPGGGAAQSVEFSDALFRIYDDGDDTKKIAFQASGITTATTRTITMANKDLDLNQMPTTFLCTAGSATPANNTLKIYGSTGMTTTGSSDQITIACVAGGLKVTELTGTGPYTASIDNAYILSNAGAVTIKLPSSAALGSQVEIIGKGAGGWTVTQNAGQTIHFIGQSTTTGVGGSLASTNQYESVIIRCITANTTWMVTSSVGNITVT